MHFLAKNKSLALTLIAVLLAACGASPSVFEWKVESPKMEWTHFLADGEIYTITSKNAQVDQVTVWTANLNRYSDNSEAWSQPIAVDGLTGVMNAHVVAGDDGERIVYVFARSGPNEHLTVFDQDGNQTAHFSIDGDYIASAISGQTLAAVISRDGADYLSLFSGSDWQDLAEVKAAPYFTDLHAQNNNWVVINHSLDEVSAVTETGELAWKLSVDDKTDLKNAQVGSDTIIAKTTVNGDSGLYFIDGLSGQNTFVPVPQLSKLLTLDSVDQPYISVGESDSVAIQKIDAFGNMLWQSGTRYESAFISSAQVAANGDLFARHYTRVEDGYDDDGLRVRVSWFIDILNGNGALSEQYAITPYLFTEQPSCVEFCAVKIKEKGYTLSSLYLDQDGDIYAKGTVPYNILGVILAHKDYFAKVNLANVSAE